MPNDFFNINALVAELNALLSTGRIDRISQPEKDELNLLIRAGGENRLLVISVNPNSPRLHLTTRKKDNPYVAPPFAMLLRKHLTGGKIISVKTVACDRIALFEIMGRNDMADELMYHLYIELMGRYSNIILADDCVILDALRHIPPDENQKRCILPKVKYLPPEQTRIAPTDPRLFEVLRGCNYEAVKYLIANVGGFAGTTAYEVFHRANVAFDRDSLTDTEARALTDVIYGFAAIYGTEEFKPCTDGKDYYMTPYGYTEEKFESYTTFNEVVDVLCSEKDRIARLKSHGKSIAAALKTAETKAVRLIKSGQQKLEECKNAEDMKKKGDLITCYLYLLKKGDEKAVLTDYETQEPITVTLDGRLSPIDNAQVYYKKYAKLKRTAKIVTVQLAEQTALLNYIQSVKTAFELTEEVCDYAEIEKELQNAGIMKKPALQKGRKVKEIPMQIATYSIEGFKVIRGKNNLQNEAVTFKQASENDLWFHARNSHGSHVILFTDGKTIPSAVIERCAALAAYYSEQQSSGKATVDYTLRKNVSRHPSKQPGLVNYVKYSEIIVKPEKTDE